MKILAVSILTIFSISCAKVKIKPHVNRLYDYSGEFGSCYEYDIIFSKERVGKIGQGREVELSECKNLLGFKIFDEDGNDFPAFKAWVEIDVFEAVLDGNGNLIIDMDFNNGF